MEKLNLKKVTCHAVEASVDEYRSIIRGYYKDFNIASVDAKGAGWYGSDGKVVSVEIFEDEDGNLYSAKPLGKYTDVSRQYADETMKKIREKLTPEEMNLLGIKI